MPTTLKGFILIKNEIKYKYLKIIIKMIRLFLRLNYYVRSIVIGRY